MVRGVHRDGNTPPPPRDPTGLVGKGGGVGEVVPPETGKGGRVGVREEG